MYEVVFLLISLPFLDVIGFKSKVIHPQGYISCICKSLHRPSVQKILCIRNQVTHSYQCYLIYNALVIHEVTTGLACGGGGRGTAEPVNTSIGLFVCHTKTPIAPFCPVMVQPGTCKLL